MRKIILTNLSYRTPAPFPSALCHAIIIRHIDSSGECVVKYIYNSWGKVVKVTDGQGKVITSSTHIGQINPIRYRSYYYDTDLQQY